MLAMDFPKIDPAIANPIPAILCAPEFAHTCDGIMQTEASNRSLISATSSALIYALIRNFKPDHVWEIGTFDGGTSEIICGALRENGFGTLHTVGPFDAHRVNPIFNAWPYSLRSHLRFYPVTSMDFYIEMARHRVHPEIVFVDGDHAYESALFDIQCAARSLKRKGLIIVDNVSQAGPYYAVMDFLSANPDWTRCKAREPIWADPTKAFDRERTSIPETDFEILRAPPHWRLTERPRSFGEIASGRSIAGLRLEIGSPATGTLHAQCILRGFGPRMAEAVASTKADLNGSGQFELIFAAPVVVEGEFERISVEPWFVWCGGSPLELTALPEVMA